jgi:phosphatidylinositol 4-kinase B
LQTFWFMQASLNDLALTRRDTPSFVVCQRVLHRCHQIIFGDIPPPVPAPYSSLAVPARSRFLRKKVKARFEPALVGMGCVLAGATGMPRLAEVTGKVAVEQGRWEDATVRRLPVNLETEEDAAPGAQSSRETSVVDEESEEEEEELDVYDLNGAVSGRGDAASKSSSSLVGSTGHKQRVRAAQTTPTLPLQSLLGSRTPRLSDDPLGQFDGPLSPSSSPVISESRRQPVRHNSMSVDFLLKKYDLYSQREILRGHYLRGEVGSFNIDTEPQLHRSSVSGSVSVGPGDDCEPSARCSSSCEGECAAG